MRFSCCFAAAAAALLARGAMAADQKQMTAADYFVRSLPGQPEGPLVKMHAGHIEVDAEHNGHLFFWHFQNRHIAQKQRTVLWLNGGPGCSSMDGALMEVGPYRMKDEKTLEHNNGSWHEFANLLFVDQPVGTGFSYVNTDAYLKELDQMAAHMITFLEKWYKLFPEYEGDDLYIAGESYAGQHIPYIADSILKRNKEAGGQKWNLKGLLIGNGWIDSEPQYKSYLAFAYKHGIVKKDSELGTRLEKQQEICIKELAAGGKDHVDVQSCELILQDILQLTQHKSSKGENVCWNMYDVRLEDTYPSCGMNWPPDLPNLTKYLQSKEVIQALHINPDKKTGWTECSGSVSRTFRARNSKPSVKLLPGILEEVPVLLFSGDQDLICNHIGTEDLINNLHWNNGTGFEISPGNWAPREDWHFEDQPAGYYQTARNLTYLLFYNSSHMVPFDVPRRSRDMLDRFMGVDISYIGGTPSNSKIDGQKGPLTSVGDHPNSTTAEQAQKEKLQQARWDAYYKSGEVALVLVATAAVIWGVWIWRMRRAQAQRRAVEGYKQVDAAASREWDLEGQVELGERREPRYSLGSIGASDTELSEDEMDLKTKPNGEKARG